MGKHYTGSSIQCDRQDELKRKFDGPVRNTVRCYRRHGYVGPVDVDILETAGSDNHMDKNGKLGGKM